jgi:hypothetical protein
LAGNAPHNYAADALPWQMTLDTIKIATCLDNIDGGVSNDAANHLLRGEFIDAYALLLPTASSSHRTVVEHDGRYFFTCDVGYTTKDYNAWLVFEVDSL